MAVNVRCKCGYCMELPDDWAGKQGRCPQCRAVLEIPALRASATPEPRAPQRVESPAEPFESTDGFEPPAPFLARLRSAERQTLSPLTAIFSSPRWLTTIAAGIAFLIVGVWMLRRDRTLPRAEPAEADQSVRVEDTGGSKKKSDVFRPSIQSDDSAIEPPPSDAAATSKRDSRISGDAGDSAGRGADTPRVASSGPAARSAAPLASWSIREFGVEIPSGASVIEIDGVSLPVKSPAALAARGGVPFVLPMGKHVVRFARTGPARVVEPPRWFLDGYREAMAAVQDSGKYNFDRLLEASRGTLDRFTDPLVPHLWGNYYWQEGERAAAERHYSWAIEIAPTFAPAYLNLAVLAHDRGDCDAAFHYLRLADLWNAQNAFGLARAAAALRASLGDDEPPPDENEPDWIASRHDDLAPRDRDLIAVMKSAAEFAPRRSESAKILNNIGAYFEHEGKPELALEHYRTAAGALGSSKLGADERRVIEAILANLARVCRNANMPEAKRYERMLATVGR